MITSLNNEQFFADTHQAFTELFELAKKKNELHYAFALQGEFNPYNYANSIGTDIAFEDYISFLQKKDYPELRPRIALSFYCHLSEASCYWEIIKNMLCIVNGERYNILPFSKFVSKNCTSGKLILPNANKIFKSLAGLANQLGINALIPCLESAYDPDMRNGFAHADYVVIEKGISFGNRYSNQRIILWDEFNLLLNRGIGFYSILKDVLDSSIEHYLNEKTTLGCLDKEPVATWYMYFDKEKNTFNVGNISFTKGI